jgi:hypothetical protein
MSKPIGTQRLLGASLLALLYEWFTAPRGN